MSDAEEAPKFDVKMPYVVKSIDWETARIEGSVDTAVAKLLRFWFEQGYEMVAFQETTLGGVEHDEDIFTCVVFQHVRCVEHDECRRSSEMGKRCHAAGSCPAAYEIPEFSVGSGRPNAEKAG